MVAVLTTHLPKTLRRFRGSAAAVLLLCVAAQSLFAETYVFERQWGSNGTGSNQFQLPFALALSYNDLVFVSDTGNHRVQIFSTDGTFVTTWGSLGTGAGELSAPKGLAYNPVGSTLYVLEGGNNRVQKFGQNGVPRGTWGSAGSGPGQFQLATEIALDGQNNVYVADRFNNRIQVFSSDGALLTLWGSQGSGDGQLHHPQGVAVKGDFVYVADSDNNRIQVFNTTGTYLKKWGSQGTGSGQFLTLAGIALDASGNLYAADYENHRIQKFTSQGQFIASWGGFGSNPGQFKYPTDVDLDASGNVYVADWNNYRIQKFNRAYLMSGTAKDIAGNALTDVTLTVSGPSGTGATLITGSDGAYTATLLAGTGYSLSASKGGYVFGPDRYAYVPASADLTGQNFTGYIPAVVSGTVRDSASAALAGIMVSASGPLIKTTTTDASGTYQLTLAQGFDATLRAVPGYLFNPEQRTYQPLSADQTAQDFSRFLLVILAGTISDRDGKGVSNVTLAVTDGVTQSFLSDTLGVYRITLISGRNYAVTPSNGDWTFDPSSRSYTALSTDKVTEAFTGFLTQVILSLDPSAGAQRARSSLQDGREVSLDIPAGAFGQATNLGLSWVTSFPAVGPAHWTPVGIGVQITASVQPGQTLTLALTYPASTATGREAGRFRLARYLESSGSWAPLVSTADPVTRTVTAGVRHFSTYQVLEVGTPATAADVQVIPMPWKPGSGGAYDAATLLFRNLPDQATVTIYTLLGESLVTLTVPAGSSETTWNGLNAQGVKAATGTYLYTVSAPGGQKATGKFLVVR